MLDRKEALLTQLRTMNDEAEAGIHLDSSGRHTEAFQAAYAKVVLELKQARSRHLSGNSRLPSLALFMQTGNLITRSPQSHGCTIVS